jgi:NAD(P)-dependent dehydrogenase (short-subunit alcohol dehydrogenase family)
MASVLITGASKGIGRATAAEFARRGHRVIATARDPRTLADLSVDRRLTLDVTDPDTIARAVREAGQVDVPGLGRTPGRARRPPVHPGRIHPRTRGRCQLT